MTTPTPAIMPRNPTSRAALEDLVSNLATRIAADASPDLEEVEILATLTTSLARLIQARAAERAIAKQR